MFLPYKLLRFEEISIITIGALFNASQWGVIHDVRACDGKGLELPSTRFLGTP
jgi:hypothetical protein